MIRDQPDIDNNPALIKWAGGATSRFAFEDTGSGTAPFMEISYAVSAGSPVASFTSNITTGVMPLQVQFTDTSTGTPPLTYAWDFDNNGSTDSTVKNPVFTYSTAGTYTVKLKITNNAGTNTLTKTNYITVTAAPVGPVAGFSANVTSGSAPLAVQFTDISTGTPPLTYAWDFDNNGVTDSSLKNPVFTYSTAGTYTVKLNVTNGAGTNTSTRSNYITVTTGPVGPVAGFSANVTSGSAPLAVQFTDTSTGTPPLTYAWDFDNNGSTDSTVKNPVFTYSTAGTYTVKLKVTNSAGTNTSTRSNYITVTTAPVGPVAGFSANVTSGSAPLAVQFTDTSTGTPPLTYAWDFDNNGVTDSSLKNPVFTYSTAGTYTVKLKVTNSAGTNTLTRSNYLTVTSTGTSPPGIALTFDDDSVDAWYAIRPILQSHGAHATFFVSNFANLDQTEINELLTLQADGNEIAFHGYNHEDQIEYLQSHSLDDYMNNEIIRGVNLMKSAGFNPVDFAYPYGSDDPRATAALEAYFLHMRDTYYDWDNTIYYEYGSNTPFISGIGIDDTTYGNSITDIYNGMAKAKTDDRILIFYGHKPVAGNPAEYETSYERLENILQYASDNSLKTYTISEIH